MKTVASIASAMLLAVAAAIVLSAPVPAKTAKECAAEWKQMKVAKQTAGEKRKAFIAQCRAEGASPKTAAPASAPAAKPVAKRRVAAPAPVATGKAVFPSAISPKYSKESPGKARMHTCRDQYQTNKATGGNGGLKWIQKGGGYYSECNKRLKG